jgi:hypothetical protein
MGTTSKAERDLRRHYLSLNEDHHPTETAFDDITFHVGDKQVTVSWLRRMTLINFWLAVASLIYTSIGLFIQFRH